MKIVIVGAGEVGIMVAKTLLSRGHDVVIVEKEREVIDSLYDELDCSFIHGDGTRPAILKETSPASADVLFALTESDQSNIIASLVGRTLGVARVVTSIENPDFESVCHELGLEHTVVPPRTIARYLADMVEDVDVLELSTFIRGEGRFFMFAVGDGDAGATVAKLELPSDARAVCLYREGVFHLVDDEKVLDVGDEVVVLTHARNLAALREKFKASSGQERASET